jgi:hypothetical protein
VVTASKGVTQPIVVEVSRDDDEFLGTFFTLPTQFNAAKQTLWTNLPRDRFATRRIRLIGRSGPRRPWAPQPGGFQCVGSCFSSPL